MLVQRHGRAPALKRLAGGGGELLEELLLGGELVLEEGNGGLEAGRGWG